MIEFLFDSLTPRYVKYVEWLGPLATLLLDRSLDSVTYKLFELSYLAGLCLLLIPK